MNYYIDEPNSYYKNGEIESKRIENLMEDMYNDLSILDQNLKNVIEI